MRFRFRTAVVVLFLILLSACGGSDDAEGPESDETGTVVVEQTPDDLPGAGWTITGQQGAQGTGDVTMTQIPAGEYSVTWIPVAGYITPSRDTQTLSADGIITFVGTYVMEDETGTVVIDQTPSNLAGAGWTLTGEQEASGAGDTTLTEMPAGQYAITWDSVDGYVTPSGDTQTLSSEGVITFNGTYIEEVEAGTVVIDQTPNSLAEAGWTIAGPQEESGAGDVTLTDMPIGNYTITWEDVEGYSTPADDANDLESGETITFSGVYNQEGVDLWVGDWLSEGDNVAVILSTWFNIDSVRVAFHEDNTTDLSLHDTVTESWTDNTGNYLVTESDEGDIHSIYISYTGGPIFEQEGIIRVVEGSPDVLTLEVVQTVPDIGATPLTPDDGFGADPNLGTTNIQTYVRED